MLQIRHIGEQWHSTLMSQDLAGLVALYGSEIERLFARNFANLKTEFSELYRGGLFFSNGRLLTWEYPRLTPNGTQVDLFESMDIENELIVYHRVYRHWQDLKALLAVRKS